MGRGTLTSDYVESLDLTLLSFRGRTTGEGIFSASQSDVIVPSPSREKVRSDEVETLDMFGDEGGIFAADRLNCPTGPDRSPSQI